MPQLGKYMVVTEFVPARGKKTKTWEIRSSRSGDLLGIVSWYPSWRRYTFQPCQSTVFSSDCLHEIENMLDRVNAEHKLRGVAP